jgi:hypothetical protein
MPSDSSTSDKLDLHQCVFSSQQRPSYRQCTFTANTKDFPLLHTEPQSVCLPPPTGPLSLQYRHITDAIYYLHNRRSLRVYQSFLTSDPYRFQLPLTCSLSATNINHAKIRWLNLYKRLRITTPFCAVHVVAFVLSVTVSRPCNSLRTEILLFCLLVASHSCSAWLRMACGIS